MDNESRIPLRRHGLSKSRIGAFEQCPKRLWLQVHRPDVTDPDPTKELRFAAGHEVGEVACSLVANGIMIEADPDLTAALIRTAELIEARQPVPLFEATFVHDGVLVRVDIMEPYADGTWHVAEVKSATSRKDCYVPDLATQLWVLEENGVPVRSAAIRHIDNQFVLEKEGCFTGFLVDASSLDETVELVRNRAEVVNAAREVLAGPEPVNDIGEHCSAPYSCEFGGYCAQRVEQPKWPISLLPNTGRKLAAQWAEQGISELTDVPPDRVVSPLHARIHHATCSGEPFHDVEGARRATAGWAWPRSYLDFETIAFAVPRWIGTRPWQQVPFQFSLHIDHGEGKLEHREFLCLGTQDPRRLCAEALVRSLPPEGAIIAYNANFERTCIKQLAALFPDLREELTALATRIVDLLPVARNHWYHLDQRGSWSIKAVLPTISIARGYTDLIVTDGSAAQTAYLEASHANCSPERRQQIESDLRAYCALDTQAMIVLLSHLCGLRRVA